MDWTAVAAVGAALAGLAAVFALPIQLYFIKQQLRDAREKRTEDRIAESISKILVPLMQCEQKVGELMETVPRPEKAWVGESGQEAFEAFTRAYYAWEVWLPPDIRIHLLHLRNHMLSYLRPEAQHTLETFRIDVIALRQHIQARARRICGHDVGPMEGTAISSRVRQDGKLKETLKAYGLELESVQVRASGSASPAGYNPPPLTSPRETAEVVQEVQTHVAVRT